MVPMTRLGPLIGSLPILGLLTAGALPLAPTSTAPLRITVPGDADTDAAKAPPGMVMVTAGDVLPGADVDEILELAAANSKLKRAVAAEHGDKKVQVPTFYIQATEVTNEQYVEFVKATEHQPPIYWAADALAQANQVFTKEQAKLRHAEREAGNKNPERKIFDEFLWWRINWEGAEWQLPEGTESLPVTMVSFRDAEAYCTWAGLRLPSEFEWLAAAKRGKDGQRFPWGDEWDDTKAVTSSMRPRSEASPVGSMPEGAALHGTAQVFDLSGNVWEWTSSYLEPLPGYDAKELVLQTGTGRNKRKTNLVARFDNDENVVKGGSFGNDDIAARTTTRQGQQRSQQLELLGFRTAADLVTGTTFARNLDENLSNALRPGGSLAPDFALVRDRYEAHAGSIEVPGYQVITDYSYIAFVPVAEIETRSANDLTKETVKEGPRGLGIFSTSVEILEPALAPGTYMVAYRGPGKERSKRDKDEDEPEDGNEVGARDANKVQDEEDAADSGEPFDLTVANLIFYNETADIVGVIQIEELDADKLERGIDPRGSLVIQPWVEPRKPDPELVPVDTLMFDSFIPSGRRGYVFKTPINLKVAKDAIDRTWRE